MQHFPQATQAQCLKQFLGRCHSVQTSDPLLGFPAIVLEMPDMRGRWAVPWGAPCVQEGALPSILKPLGQAIAAGQLQGSWEDRLKQPPVVVGGVRRPEATQHSAAIAKQWASGPQAPWYAHIALRGACRGPCPLFSLESDAAPHAFLASA